MSWTVLAAESPIASGTSGYTGMAAIDRTALWPAVIQRVPAREGTQAKTPRRMPALILSTLPELVAD
jgi:hypothetical protein